MSGNVERPPTEFQQSQSSFVLLQCRHNECYVVSNHQPHDCLLNRLFRCISKKTSKLRVIGLCEGNAPHKGPVTRKMLPFDDVIMWCWNQNIPGELAQYNGCSCPAVVLLLQCKWSGGHIYINILTGPRLKICDAHEPLYDHNDIFIWGVGGGYDYMGAPRYIWGPTYQLGSRPVTKIHSIIHVPSEPPW